MGTEIGNFQRLMTSMIRVADRGINNVLRSFAKLELLEE
jgi:hypothetical protein